MEKMLILIAAVVFGFIGSGQRLLKSWILFLCAAFSIYTAVWGLSFLSAQITFLPKESEPYKNLILIAAAWIVMEMIFHSIVSKNFTDLDNYEFPSLVDRLGGIFFGVLSGILFLGVISLAVATSPLCEKIPSISRNDLVEISGKVIPKLTSGIDGFSFQTANPEKAKFLDSLYFKEEAPQEDLEAKLKAKKEQAQNAENSGGEAAAETTESKEQAHAPAAPLPARKATRKIQSLLAKEQEDIEEEASGTEEGKAAHPKQAAPKASE